MLAGRPHEAVGNGSPRWMIAAPREREHRTRPTGRLTPIYGADLGRNGHHVSWFRSCSVRTTAKIASMAPRPRSSASGSAHVTPHWSPSNADTDGLPQVRATATARRQRSPKAFRCATLPSRLVTITSPGPVPKRWTCVLISFSTHSSAGIVRVDASVFRSAASWPRCACDSTWILRRRKSTRGTVRPNASLAFDTTHRLGGGAADHLGVAVSGMVTRPGKLPTTNP
jgi:hypothetical protein